MTTATYSYDEQPVNANPLRPGASPAAISADLMEEDRPGFAAACGQALAQARDSWEPAGLYRMLEQWRRLAVLQQDPAAFRTTVRRVAGALTGQQSPDDEPLAVTRTKAQM